MNFISMYVEKDGFLIGMVSLNHNFVFKRLYSYAWHHQMIPLHVCVVHFSCATTGGHFMHRYSMRSSFKCAYFYSWLTNDQLHE